jgi:hypothetical protein
MKQLSNKKKVKSNETKVSEPKANEISEKEFKNSHQNLIEKLESDGNRTIEFLNHII